MTSFKYILTALSLTVALAPTVVPVNATSATLSEVIAAHSVQPRAIYKSQEETRIAAHLGQEVVWVLKEDNTIIEAAKIATLSEGVFVLQFIDGRFEYFKLDGETTLTRTEAEFSSPLFDFFDRAMDTPLAKAAGPLPPGVRFGYFHTIFSEDGATYSWVPTWKGDGIRVTSEDGSRLFTLSASDLLEAFDD